MSRTMFARLLLFSLGCAFRNAATRYFVADGRRRAARAAR